MGTPSLALQSINSAPSVVTIIISHSGSTPLKSRHRTRCTSNTLTNPLLAKFLIYYRIPPSLLILLALPLLCPSIFNGLRGMARAMPLPLGTNGLSCAMSSSNNTSSTVSSTSEVGPDSGSFVDGEIWYQGCPGDCPTRFGSGIPSPTPKSINTK